jgi:hypothetical protein
VEQQTSVLLDSSLCTIGGEPRGPLPWGFMNSILSATRLKLRRRSKRLRLNVPVEVIAFDGERELFRETAQMRCVNAHGGLLVTDASVSAGQVLRLINKQTQEGQDCRVVHVESTENSKWASGIEFLQPAANFWQISFPAITASSAAN